MYSKVGPISVTHTVKLVRIFLLLIFDINMAGKVDAAIRWLLLNGNCGAALWSSAETTIRTWSLLYLESRFATEAYSRNYHFFTLVFSFCFDGNKSNLVVFGLMP